ncbi:MAG: hypothetical protein KAI43_04790 [Candidatus Aureabacteria bacterium]|nr:hypothetical protein [Candidatus Auribacterota bacterium]
MKHSNSHSKKYSGRAVHRISEHDCYDIQSLFRRTKDTQYHSDHTTAFPEGINVEELKRLRSLNAPFNVMGYDSILEKFLKNIVSKRTFNFYKNE